MPGTDRMRSLDQQVVFTQMQEFVKPIKRENVLKEEKEVQATIYGGVEDERMISFLAISFILNYTYIFL